MASQKQRRKRAKEKRHAYDLVEIDGEGNETVLTASDLKVEGPSASKPTSRAGRAKGNVLSGRGVASSSAARSSHRSSSRP